MGTHDMTMSQMSLTLPPIPRLLIKLLLLAHILLVAFVFLGWSGGGFYLYLNLLFFLLVLVHLHLPSHPEPLPSALAINVLSILYDIVAIGVGSPNFNYATSVNIFSYICCIANVCLRFFSSLVLYRAWVAEAGKDGGTVIQVKTDNEAQHGQ